ncbi:MAG: AI-2E family transporter [Candidatus Eremiobacteraeota bacterium]|nr:AI-2E family transporter [Candidatus Eremiobacteraeota bacterium]
MRTYDIEPPARVEPERPGALEQANRLTKWLKIALLVLIVWLLLEKVTAYFRYVGFAALIAVGGLFLAYLMYPLVRRVSRKLPLGASVVLVYAGFACIVGLAAFFLIPILTLDLEQFVMTLPHLQSELRGLIYNPNFPFMQHASPKARLAIDAAVAGFASQLRANAMFATSSVLTAALSFVSLAALLIAIPATSIYMLLEADPARRFFLETLPHRYRRKAGDIIDQIDVVLGGFVRGQVLVAVTVALMVAVMLEILRVPYAILIGVWAGVLDLIPYLGAAAGAVPAVLVALLTNGLLDAALASAGFAVIFELEGNLIAPKIVSRTVGVSPLAVIFAVLVGGEAFGFGGMLVAVPVVGVVRVIIENVKPRALHPEPDPELEAHSGREPAREGHVEVVSGAEPAARRTTPV